MFKIGLALIAIIAAYAYMMDDSNAMAKCQEKHSYATCVLILR
jgi:hypothetical protein